MDKIIITLEKDDVKTSKMGNNYMINCDGVVNIVFTPDAIEELYKDFKYIKSQNKKE